jgi:hypothetical protein
VGNEKRGRFEGMDVYEIKWDATLGNGGIKKAGAQRGKCPHGSCFIRRKDGGGVEILPLAQNEVTGLRLRGARGPLVPAADWQLVSCSRRLLSP